MSDSERTRRFSQEALVRAQGLLEANRSHCNWISSYGFVSTLIESISAVNVLEVGVAYGYHADYLLDRHPSIHYVGVDPYVHGYDPQDSFSFDVRRLFAPESAFMDLLFLSVHRNLERHLGRASLLRRASQSAAELIGNDSLDLVFIDGDHRPESVLADVSAWYPKVKEGGILCGDDFNWPGTPEVLVRFFEYLGVPLIGYRSADGIVLKWSVVKPTRT